ncbi:MAG: TetR/AcrR family transcriptional regulator [Halioglobus sp.]|nr:TetR/AcrR family transcriptional regulator [Halioglobus sp.]
MTARSNHTANHDGTRDDSLNGYQRRRQETRHQIMKAGRSLFVERGVENVSIDAITSTAGVAKGSFYNHFESRDALFDALVAETVEQLLERRSRYQPPFEDQFDLALARTWFGHYSLLSDPDACRLLLQAGSLSTGEVITNVMQQTLGDEIMEGVALGSLSHLDPDVVYAAYFGVLLMATGHLLGQGEKLDPVAGADHLTELTFAVLGLPHKPPPHYLEDES